MSMTKRALLASGATLAVASAVHAQGQPQGSNQAEDVILDHQAYHVTPEGRSQKLILSETGIAAVKKYGRPLDGHALFYRGDGRNYVLHDQKLSDGSMLFDRSNDWRRS
jgi:hypothetical protein